MDLCELCKNKPDRCSICINCDELSLHDYPPEVWKCIDAVVYCSAHQEEGLNCADCPAYNHSELCAGIEQAVKSVASTL